MMKLQAIDLRCDGQRNPLGVESTSPRLSWTLQSSARVEKQIAYQILVASDLEYLTETKADYWNSGKIDSEQCYDINYRGKPLPSMSCAYWTVRVWGRDGRESAWAQPAQWVMGILSSREWIANWIGAIDDEESRLPKGKKFHLHHIGSLELDPWADVHELARASILCRKEIFVSEGLTRATVFLCGLGAFQLFINGAEASDHFMPPAWTDYDRRCCYLTYDVTHQVQTGNNALGVMLGNGMYNVVGGRYSKFLASYGAPKVILQMVLEYDDGRLEMFMSDSSWQWKRSPITFNCIFGGEDYDARLFEDDWHQAGGGKAGWQPVKLVSAPRGKLVNERIEPRRVVRKLSPVLVTEPVSGIKVYDLGENFAGRVSISVSGDKGSSVRILPAELIDNNGFITQHNMTSGSDDWTIEFNYIIRGVNGKETWSPSFSYTGFRFVQVELFPAVGSTEKPKLHEIMGEVIALDVEKTGSFSCSCDRIRAIYQLIDHAISSNLQSIATDCPHREKLGWLEVLYLMGPSMLYQYDLRNILPKVMADMRDAQQSDGLIPDIAPEYVIFDEGFRDSPEWGSAGILLPWQYYLFYHRTQPLKKQYASMKRYLHYLTMKSEGGIVSHGLGDWYDFGPAPFGYSQLTSNGLTATAIYYEDLLTLSRIAKLLLIQADAEELDQKAVEVKNNFNEKFLNTQQGYYDRNSQTANALPLVLSMVPDGLRDSVGHHLINDLHEKNYQITAGDIGHVYVLRALKELARHEEALKTIRRELGNGYLHQLMMGATALTEAWDASESSSHNHMMLGHAMEWFYTVLGGLNFDQRFPESHEFVVNPEPVADIEWASVHYQSVYGPINVMWTLQDEIFSLELSVPINTSALVYLPVESPRFVKESGISVFEIPGSRFLRSENGKCIFEVQSGNYEFRMDWHRE